MKPHKHAELIKAWADGAEIQARHLLSSLSNKWSDWKDDNQPYWLDSCEYRIKPESKPNLVKTLHIWFDNEFSEITLTEITDVPNLKLTFDGETGELKSAEVLK